jgi:predicted hotdog family 3-hydroxylacyl-ACP dehydratase
MSDVVFPSVAELVPHEPPMLLVDELLEWSADAALVGATIRAGSPFVSGDRMPATILLEYMAQAIAVANGMSDRQQGRAIGELGLLLGTREFELCCDELAVGDALELRVVREFADGKLARYACTTTRAGELLARATINVMTTAAEEIRTT